MNQTIPYKRHQEGKIFVKDRFYAWIKIDKDHYEIRDYETGEFIENCDTLDSFRIDKEAE